MTQQIIHARQSLSQAALAAHLAIERSSVPRIAEACGLQALHRRFPCDRVLRRVHGIEPGRLDDHLARLRIQYPDSPLLGAVKSLSDALMAPLMTFEAMAAAHGVRPNTLSRALKEYRTALGFPELQLGPRLRRYRPLEVRLWVEEEIALTLPPALRIVGPDPVATPPAPTRKGAPGAHTGTAATAGEAIFGIFARDKTQLCGTVGKKQNSH